MISIRLEDPDGAPLPAARPGQFLTVRVPPDGARRPVLRNYSLSGPPDAGYYRIAVKREPDGAASGYLHTRLRVGDRLEIAAPRGTFVLDRTDAPVLLVSAGIGATPVLAMLHALAEEHSRAGDLVAARRPQRPRALLRGGGPRRSSPRSRTRASTSATAAPIRTTSRAATSTRAGRLTAALLAELEPPRDAQAYVCGPAPFMEEISAGLTALGVDAAHIHTEPFGPAAGLTPGIAAIAGAAAARSARAPPGAARRSSSRAATSPIPWSDDFGSLLELAEACDVPVRWSCRTGVCHNCETTLVAGAVDYDPDPVEPPAEGSALICCSRPHDDLVLDL